MNKNMLNDIHDQQQQQLVLIRRVYKESIAKVKILRILLNLVNNPEEENPVSDWCPIHTALFNMLKALPNKGYTITELKNNFGENDIK